MSLHNGDKSRANRIRRHKQLMRERSRKIREQMAAAAGKKSPTKK